MRILTMAALFCGLMMTGCAQKETVVDLAAERCPPVRAADAATLRQSPQSPPQGDLTDAALKGWIDGLEGQVEAKAKAGERVMWQYNRCRKGGDQS